MQIKEIEEQHGAWTFLAPIKGLRLTASVNYELRVDRVTFIDARHLTRRRHHLGFPYSLREFKDKTSIYQGHEQRPTQTFAVVRQTGKSVRSEVEALVRDELAVLSASQLGFGRRRRNAHPAISDNCRAGTASFVLLNTSKNSGVRSFSKDRSIGELVLEQRWKTYSKDSFFLPLVKILQGGTGVSSKWRNQLHNAAVLVGQSQTTADLPLAFLWNVIALESLLTVSDDKVVEKLPERTEAFIGWVSSWEAGGYKERLKEIYRKRCNLVHAGVRDEVTPYDVVFTDLILLNVLINIAKHPKIFRSKQALIDVSDKVRAEQILGISGDKRVKSVVRPKTMEYHHPIYREDEIVEI